MDQIRDINTEPSAKTERLKSSIRHLRIDLIGIANRRTLDGMPVGVPADSRSFLERFQSAIVLGVQLGKLGRKAGVLSYVLGPMRPGRNIGRRDSDEQ